MIDCHRGNGFLGRQLDLPTEEDMKSWYCAEMDLRTCVVLDCHRGNGLLGRQLDLPTEEDMKSWYCAEMDWRVL